MCLKINLISLLKIFIIFLLTRHIINILIKIDFFKRYAIEKINALKKICESEESNEKILSQFKLENFKMNDLKIKFLSLKNISFEFSNINGCYSGFIGKTCFHKTNFFCNISLDYCPTSLKLINSSIIIDSETKKTLWDRLTNNSVDSKKDLIIAYLELFFKKMIFEMQKAMSESWKKHMYLFFVIEMYASIYDKVIQNLNFEVIFEKILKKVKLILIYLINKIDNNLLKKE